MIDLEFRSLRIEKVVYRGTGKIWLYSRHDDFFYIVRYDWSEFTNRVVNDRSAMLKFFRELLSMLGELDAKIEWIVRFMEKGGRFVGFYCCYRSKAPVFGKAYVVLLVFNEDKDWVRDRLELASRLELMRKLWVYLPE